VPVPVAAAVPVAVIVFVLDQEDEMDDVPVLERVLVAVLLRV
jgi:hypothetical protein